MTPARPQPIAYVLTHYPQSALTFIALEIAEMERRGHEIVPVAVNAPRADDLRSPEAQAAEQRTHYLKSQGLLTFARSFASAWVRHPRGMTRLTATAVASARLDLPLAARRLVHLAYACWTWNVANDRGIRHFHAHFGQTPATIAWFAAEVGNICGSDDVTWSFTIHGFQDFADERLTRLDLKVASASFVVCVSDFTRAQLCRVTDPSTWDRFYVVRCGIDLDTFTRRAEVPRHARPRVVTVARLSPEKGHLVLLDAVRMLRDDGVDVELRIVGDGPSEAAVVDFVRRHGLEDRVTLLGVLASDRVAAELTQADIFCLPSFAEGIPVSIMEAMAVGVPVVTTYVGGIPELALDGVTAAVVPASDSVLLADALRRLAGDEQLRARVTEAGRAAVEERHDARRNAAALDDVFSRHT